MNGIYDIICGINLLCNYIPYINLLHTTIYNKINKSTQRHLGYLLLIIGYIRISSNNNLIITSYIFEALLFEIENIYNNMDIMKVRFITLSSLLLALYTYNL